VALWPADGQPVHVIACFHVDVHFVDAVCVADAECPDVPPSYHPHWDLANFEGVPDDICEAWLVVADFLDKGSEGCGRWHARRIGTTGNRNTTGRHRNFGKAQAVGDMSCRRIFVFRN